MKSERENFRYSVRWSRTAFARAQDAEMFTRIPKQSEKIRQIGKNYVAAYAGENSLDFSIHTEAARNDIAESLPTASPKLLKIFMTYPFVYWNSYASDKLAAF